MECKLFVNLWAIDLMDQHMHLLREVLGDTSFVADETEPKKSLKSSPGIVPNSPVSL